VIADNLLPLATPLDDLHLLPGNPRRGDVEAVARSLERFGQLKPIVARLDGTIIAGNHTFLAARQLGWTELAVVRTDADEATAKAFALADNRTSELGTYDEQALLDLLTEVNAADPTLLAAASFAATDLDDLLARLTPPPTDGDNTPATAPAITALGDMWRLGPHRLMCGDSADATVLDRAVGGARIGCLLTDPPYGMNLDTDWSGIGGSSKAILRGTPGGNYRPVLHDDRPYDASILRAYAADVREQFWFGADYYRRTLTADDLDGSWLVWDKRTESSDPGFGSGFELIWSAQRHKRDLLRCYWFGAFGGAEAAHRMHPTQKPTRLLAEILTRWAPDACTVLDPYAGSGSTLIAAHQTGRTARLVELDPRYVDVIARRWQEATGVEPVNEATGVPHDFTAPG